MVCTDIASRGLDTTAVDNIILFDCPINTIDYLQRIGRTARAGASGRVTSFITKRDQVLADKIQEALRTGKTLENLTSNKSEKETAMLHKEKKN